MSRLIDADELIKNIKIWEIGTSISSDQKEFIDCIDKQPTAFDADKVVEQLEDIKRKKYRACQDVICDDCKYSEDCCEGNESDKLALDKAIELVKGGEVE